MAVAEMDLWQWLDGPDLHCLSHQSKINIKAKLLMAHGDCFGHPDHGRDFHCEAFDVIANEFFEAGALTETLISDGIPKMVCRAECSTGIKPPEACTRPESQLPVAYVQNATWSRMNYWRGRLLLPGYSPKKRSTKAARAKARSAWLDEKHTDGTSDSKLGSPTYNTLHKWRTGVVTNRTPSIRRDLSKRFHCPLNQVPE